MTDLPFLETAPSYLRRCEGDSHHPHSADTGLVRPRMERESQEPGPWERRARAQESPSGASCNSQGQRRRLITASQMLSSPAREEAPAPREVAALVVCDNESLNVKAPGQVRRHATDES